MTSVPNHRALSNGNSHRRDGRIQLKLGLRHFVTRVNEIIRAVGLEGDLHEFALHDSSYTFSGVLILKRVDDPQNHTK